MYVEYVTVFSYSLIVFQSIYYFYFYQDIYIFCLLTSFFGDVEILLLNRYSKNLE